MMGVGRLALSPAAKERGYKSPDCQHTEHFPVCFCSQEHCYSYSITHTSKL